MALTTEDREINGAAYSTTRFPARRALKIGTRLVKLVGPAIGALGGGVKIADGKLKEVDSDVFGVAIKALVSQIHEDEVIALMLEILSSTTRVDPQTHVRHEVNKPEVFDEVYAGNFGELIGALRFALEVSLSSFFSGSSISGFWDRARALVDRLTPASASSQE